ncbi:MAG: cation:proton antiporter, partial [Victivallaceae bacterium]
MTNDLFLIIFLVFMIAMTIAPLLLRRLKIPGVIALLLVGMLIGPSGIDLVGKLSEGLSFLSVASPAVIADHTNNLITSLGALGLVFLMSLAGMEADFKSLGSVKLPTAMLSIMTFIIPAMTGYFVYYYFRPDDLPGKLLYASLFASHSVGIVFPVIRELKLGKTKFGAAVLISTVITDIASIILLAVAVQMRRQSLGDGVELSKRTLSVFDSYPDVFGNHFMLGFLIVVILYLIGAWLLVPRLARFFTRLVGDSEDGLVTTLLMIIAGTVLVGEVLGINLVVGAFVAGLSLAPFIQRCERIMLFHKFEGIGYGFLIPFLFVSIGMETDFSILFAADNFAGNMTIIVLTVLGLIGSKIISGYSALRICKYPGSQAFCAGLMTVPQLSATL